MKKACLNLILLLLFAACKVPDTFTVQGPVIRSNGDSYQFPKIINLKKNKTYSVELNYNITPGSMGCTGNPVYTIGNDMLSLVPAKNTGAVGVTGTAGITGSTGQSINLQFSTAAVNTKNPGEYSNTFTSHFTSQSGGKYFMRVSVGCQCSSIGPSGATGAAVSQPTEFNNITLKVKPN